MSRYRGHCDVHPDEPFPLRAAPDDAGEDAIRHLHTSGGHSIHVTTVTRADTGDDRHGYPPDGYARELAVQARRDLDAFRPHDKEDTMTTTLSDRTTWTERDHRMALTVWAEPDNPALGDWIGRLSATGSNSPVRDLVDLVTHHEERLKGDEVTVAGHIGPRIRTAGVLDEVRAWHHAHPDVRFLIPGDPDWPTRLDDLGDARPYGLWLRGDPSLLQDGRSVCFDGSRASTSYGEQVTRELVTDLVGRHVTIITGAAYGIEGTATRATLASGGRPVAVLASGIDRPYPAGNQDLIDRVAQHGVVVSEIPPGLGPTRWRFLARNRLLAALSDTVIIPEAGARSGSLHTATRAEQLGRIIGTVPGPITSAASAGCHRLLQETDAYLITGASDVIDIM